MIIELTTFGSFEHDCFNVSVITLREWPFVANPPVDLLFPASAVVLAFVSLPLSFGWVLYGHACMAPVAA
jgi:hypothetical protein